MCFTFNYIMSAENEERFARAVGQAICLYDAVPTVIDGLATNPRAVRLVFANCEEWQDWAVYDGGIPEPVLQTYFWPSVIPNFFELKEH